MTRMSLGSLLSERLAKNRALTQIQNTTVTAVQESTVVISESTVSSPVVESTPPEVKHQENVSDIADIAYPTASDATDAIVTEMFADNAAETNTIGLPSEEGVPTEENRITH